MNFILATYLLILLQCIGFCPAAIISWAQSSKPAQVLPMHTIKIRDNHMDRKPSPSNEILLNGLHLENEADTIFVEKTWHEDMGNVYAVAYSFKKNISNGIYKFVINDTVDTETIIVSGKKEGIQKRYFDGVLNEETPYHLGMANGYGRAYSWRETHNLKSISYYYEDFRYITTELDSVGNVIGRDYAIIGGGSGIPYREEKEGFKWNMPKWCPPFTQNGIAVENGSPRNGLYELTSLFGKYQISFKKDFIEWWKWLDKDGKLMVEVHAKSGQKL